MPAFDSRALEQPSLSGPLAQSGPVRSMNGAAAGAVRELLLSPELWCAQDLAAAQGAQTPAGLPTGFEQLDRLLPNRGWPRAGLTEVLADALGIGELRLLLPGLARLSREEPRWIAWVNPPFSPHAPALAAAGVEVGKILLIRTDGFDRPAARPPGLSGEALWAVEQALQSGACSAVLAWLDERRLRFPGLRRLQLRTRQGRAWGVLFRPQRASAAPSAAELRLSIRAVPEEGNLGGVGTARRLLVSIIKRRGGWAIADLPLELDGADALQPLLQLWRRRAGI